MISPRTPAALAGIAAGAGPSTRTAPTGPRPGVMSALVSTPDDPPTSGESVAELPDEVPPRRVAAARHRRSPDAGDRE